MIDVDALPARVRDFLREILLERAHVLVLGLGKDWSLREVLGDAGWHELDIAQPGALLASLHDLFVGIEPDSDEELPFVELANGRSVHVHRLVADDGFFLILIDAEAAREAQRNPQQLANEAALAGHEKSKAIQSLKQIRSELEHQQARLEEANNLKNALIATMSHEFRTPLASAFGQLRELESRRSAGDAEIRALRRSLSHLFVLAENLLEYGRGEAGGGLLHPVPIDLHGLLDDCSSMFRPLAEAKGLAFHASLDAASSAPACFDEVKLRQILINLLANAVRYTRRGEIVLALRWDGERLHIEVRDTGIGIALEFRASVFRPFNRGAQTGSRGAGLGLSIVQRLIEQMRGRIELDSEIARGSCFRLELPGAALAAAPATRGDLQGRVFVVDDDPDITQLLEHALGGLGLEVQCFAEASSALDAALAQPPALLVVDMQMPGLSGGEMVFALRASGHRGAILVLSANATVEARDAALRVGADRYLTKPIDFAHLEASVRDLLARG